MQKSVGKTLFQVYLRLFFTARLIYLVFLCGAIKVITLQKRTYQMHYPRYRQVKGLPPSIFFFRSCMIWTSGRNLQVQWNPDISILDITIFPDLRYNDIPDIAMRIQRTEGKNFSDITILSVHSHNFSKTLNIIQ